jgi:hypothetical protein
VRHATEAELAAAHATAANVEANLHDQAAQNARATAADAERRRRTAQAEAESQPPTKRGGGKKKRATRKR